MITFELTNDMGIVKQIVTTPYIWRQISDDFDGSPEQYEAAVHAQVRYVLVKDDAETLGLLIFNLHGSICWEATIMMLPLGRGRAVETVKAGIRWIFTETKCLRIISRALTSNRLALRMNQAAGFKQYGLNPGCVMRNGKLEDYALFGVSKRDFEEIS